MTNLSEQVLFCFDPKWSLSDEPWACWVSPLSDYNPGHWFSNRTKPDKVVNLQRQDKDGTPGKCLAARTTTHQTAVLRYVSHANEAHKCSLVRDTHQSGEFWFRDLASTNLPLPQFQNLTPTQISPKLCTSKVGLLQLSSTCMCKQVATAGKLRSWYRLLVV